MIKSVRLQNFQSHKDSLFEFPNGITSLTGSSTSGKTAVLRGIKWVFENKPTGEAHCSYWIRDDKGKLKGTCSVLITFDDGTTIERIRSNKENIYKFNGQSFEAIGQAVPDAIMEVCNVNEVNYQSQMDAPFLLSESSGEVARFFNKIVKLDTIDTYLSSIDSKKRRTKADREAAKESLERTNGELSTLSWLDDADKIIRKIEKVEAHTKDLEDKKAIIEQGVVAYTKMQEILEKTSIIDEAERLSHSVTKCHQLLMDKKGLMDSLQESISRYKQQKKILDSVPDIGIAEKLYSKGKKFIGIVEEYKWHLSAIKEHLSKYKSYQEFLDNYDDDYAVLKAMLPNVCPLCGGAIHE